MVLEAGCVQAIGIAWALGISFSNPGFDPANGLLAVLCDSVVF